MIAALDTTYAIGLPDMWFTWTELFQFLGELDWATWLIPSVCVVGTDMTNLLFLRALAPLLVIILVPVLGAVVVVLRSGGKRVRTSIRNSASGRSASGAPVAASWPRRGSLPGQNLVQVNLKVALLNWLPASLVLAFCFTPSVSANVGSDQLNSWPHFDPRWH